MQRCAESGITLGSPGLFWSEDGCNQIPTFRGEDGESTFSVLIRARASGPALGARVHDWGAACTVPICSRRNTNV
jgi:hypothetical protein